VEAGWKPLKRSLFLNVQLIRTMAHHVVARAALGAARGSTGEERERFLNIAAKSTKKLDGEAPWGAALAQLLRAQLLVALDRRDRACDAFRAARDALTAADMHLDAAVARRAYGLFLGGSAGRAEAREAEAWMVNESIRRVDAMSAMLAPYGALD
jgi:hypothetical protein